MSTKSMRLLKQEEHAERKILFAALPDGELSLVGTETQELGVQPCAPSGVPTPLIVDTYSNSASALSGIR